MCVAQNAKGVWQVNQVVVVGWWSAPVCGRNVVVCCNTEAGSVGRAHMAEVNESSVATWGGGA